MLDLPPDPLLSSDSFIKGHPESTTADETLPTKQPEPTRALEATHKADTEREPEILNAKAMVIIDVDELPVKTPTMKRGRRRKSDQMLLPNVSVSTDRPEWLPDGWYVEDRVRVSGATAGHVDKYFCDPVSGNKFRSTLEVIRFRETGSKHKKADATTSTDTPVKGSSSGQRKKKSASKTSNPAPNFDFFNVPDKIGWVLKDPSQDSWTPVIANVMVDENTKNDWATTFTSLATKRIN